MRRRRILAVLLPLLVAPLVAGAQAPPPSDMAAERQRQLDAWWARQREKEAADRFWNGPREQRRNLTRDQIERWERQRDRRRGWPPYPF